MVRINYALLIFYPETGPFEGTAIRCESVDYFPIKLLVNPGDERPVN